VERLGGVSSQMASVCAGSCFISSAGAPVGDWQACSSVSLSQGWWLVVVLGAQIDKGAWSAPWRGMERAIGAVRWSGEDGAPLEFPRS